MSSAKHPQPDRKPPETPEQRQAIHTGAAVMR